MWLLARALQAESAACWRLGSTTPSADKHPAVPASPAWPGNHVSDLKASSGGWLLLGSLECSGTAVTVGCQSVNDALNHRALFEVQRTGAL